MVRALRAAGAWRWLSVAHASQRVATLVVCVHSPVAESASRWPLIAINSRDGLVLRSTPAACLSLCFCPL